LVLDPDDLLRTTPEALVEQLCWDTSQPFTRPTDGTLPRSGVFLMWWLLKVLLLIDNLRGLNRKSSNKPTVKPIGEAFPPDAVEAFERLRRWFGLDKRELKIPLTD
jgi:hypothetical protein